MRPAIAFTISASLLACGGDDTSMPDAPDNGFTTPTVTLKANMEVSSDNWMEIGPADLSCLGTPSADVVTAGVVTLNTKVSDFQSGNAVPGAMVSAFKDV